MFFQIGGGEVGMSFMSFGGPMFPFMGGGPPIPGHDYPSSDCGAEFDAYVKEAHGVLQRSRFLFGPTYTSRKLDLWKGRRLRLYKSPEDYIECKVVSFEQETNTRMSSEYPFATTWDIELEGDALEQLDLRLGKKEVTIKDTPKAHAGKKGKIVQFLSGGRYKIQMDDDPLQFLTLHKDQVDCEPTEYCFYVYKMNVHGGGILRRCGCAKPTCGVTQYSVEWIDPPTPTIDLYRSVAKATCPTCRAIEPTAQAFDDRECTVIASPSPKKKKASTPSKKKRGKGKMYQQEQEGCPICVMDKPLRTLQCGHELCQECWSKWRVSATSTMPSSVTQPEIDEKTLQKERDRAYQKMKAILPHTMMGGTATRPPTARQLTSERSEAKKRREEATDKAMDKFFDRLSSIFNDLDDTVHAPIDDHDDGRTKLIQFWTKLRKAPVHIFCLDGHFKDFLNEMFNMPGVEIIHSVLQERAEEIEAARLLYLQLASYRVEPFEDGEEQRKDPKGLETKAKGYLSFLTALCYTRIGEIHEEDKEFHSAIYWYERAISPSLNRLEVEGDSSKHAKHQLACRYNNLGLAKKRAGNLLEAQTHYETAMDYLGVGIKPMDKLDPDDLKYPGGGDDDDSTTAEPDYRAKTKVDIDRNRFSLQRELECWTGTSGRLTPGC